MQIARVREEVDLCASFFAAKKSERFSARRNGKTEKRERQKEDRKSAKIGSGEMKRRSNNKKAALPPLLAHNLKLHPLCVHFKGS